MKSILTPQQQGNLFTELGNIIKFDDACCIEGCDNTLKHTRMILEEYLSITGDFLDEVINEINSGGGYCDCEVLMNYASSEYSYFVNDAL